MGDAGVGWIAAIIVGGIAGWLAEQFMKSNMGLIMNIVLGIVGAAIASAILSYFGIALGGWVGYLSFRLYRRSLADLDRPGDTARLKTSDPAHITLMAKATGSGPRGAELMSDLVVIAFPTEAKAEEVRQKLLTMQKDYLIELGDAVVAVKDSNGNIKLNQLINTTAAGAVTGTFWGGLIGLIFLMPLVGAALGAASGTLSGYLTDVGIDDKWMKETAAAIQPGTAALFVLVRKVTADKVLERLKGEGGTVLKTSLDHTKEAALQAALAEVKAAVAASPPDLPG